MAYELRIVNSENGLNVRAEPTVHAPRMGLLAHQSKVRVTKGRTHEANGFTWLKLSDQRGWIAAEFTTLAEPETEFRIIRVDGSLNVRRAPTTQEDNVIDRLPNGYVVEVVAGGGVEADGFTWLKLVEERGWIAEAFTEMTDEVPALVFRGINIDLASSETSPDDLAPFTCCRFVYDLSQERGNEDFDVVAHVDKRIQGYIDRGLTPIVIFNHEFYGEGHFHWPEMRDESSTSLEKWDRLINRFVALLTQVAHKFGDRIIYQIWNEPDQASVAAVGVPAPVFGRMLDQCLTTILAIAPKARVITGGLVSGNPAYWRSAEAAMRHADKLAGVALHAYGRGSRGGDARFENYGTLNDLFFGYRHVRVQRFWVTEWGVLGPADRNDPPDVPEEEVGDYVKRFIRAAEDDKRVVATVYFALCDGMHNAYGLNRRDNTRKLSMWQAFR
ncbi:MAG: hypothetical protein OHK0046_41710 [Anaerolineae bacterium]